MRKYRNWAHKIGCWKYLFEDLPCQIFLEQRVPHFCSPGLRGGIHASQSSTLWSCGSHSWEFSEDKSILSLLSNLLFSSSFNTLNGNGIEGVDFKNAQCEDCALGFIWGKMKIAAQETAPQIALRICSKEAEGKVSIYVILWSKSMCNQAHNFPEGFC